MDVIAQTEMRRPSWITTLQGRAPARLDCKFGVARAIHSFGRGVTPGA